MQITEKEYDYLKRIADTSYDVIKGMCNSEFAKSKGGLHTLRQKHQYAVRHYDEEFPGVFNEDN